MNTSQAKSVSLFDLLANLGHYPTKTVGNDAWYLSPLRQEKSASFKVDVKRNVWYDHGEGVGGTVVDFLMKYKNTDVKGALAYLDNGNIESIHHVSSPRPTLFDESKINILEVKPLFSFALKNYLKEERKIPFELGVKYLKEVRYKVAHNEYYSLGFQNKSGGWALRNKFFGTATRPNDISVIDKGSNDVSCFEGFMDFLSAETLQPLKTNVIILNSVSLKNVALSYIKEKGYQNVFTFFDNDLAGAKALELFKSELPQVKSMNHIYAAFNDLNDMLQGKRMQ